MLCGILNGLSDNNIIYKETTESTNSDLKELAKNGACEGTVIMSEHQTGGKGRLGKSFYSPKGCGLYFSILLRPDFSADFAPLITVAAAVAVKRAVLTVFKTETQIKWVNDIYFGGKKFCGILTESSVSPKDKKLEFAVLGIGINLKIPENQYPEEFNFKTTAISEFAKEMPKNHKELLISEIIKEFNLFYKKIEEKEFINEYKNSSCVIGKEIEILSGEHKGKAIAIDINENAELVVLLKNGEKATLGSGDISISFNQ